MYVLVGFYILQFDVTRLLERIRTALFYIRNVALLLFKDIECTYVDIHVSLETKRITAFQNSINSN